VDSGCDIFHPGLFHADGGAYRWIDTDGNRSFDPQVDMLDWGDDTSSPLQAIETMGWYYDVEIGDWAREYEGGTFDARVDWLFVDTNLNKQRDYGRTAGFNEHTPAYGEPLFIPDDANNNGVLDPNERLLRLNRSKIAKIRENSVDYTRGQNLIDYPSTSIELSRHGTAVIGILAGGQNPGRRSLVGLAPLAEIILWSFAGQQTEESLVDAIDWGLENGARVHLYEWASWIGYHLDGSSHIEEAMDLAAAAGAAQISPAGNLANANKHASATISAGTTHHFELDVPPGYSYLVVDLKWRPPDTPLEFTITNPAGREFFPDQSGTQATPFNELEAWSKRWDSERGTALTELWLYSTSSTPLGSGIWLYSVSNPSESDISVDLMLTDFYSGWGQGIQWVEPDPYGTLCLSATADSTIAVGAHGGRYVDEFDVGVGELRDWSSRGPRIDAGRSLDLTAPDDPLSAYPGEEEFGQYSQFGGTSGAGPHVAAAAALLLQAEPGLDGHQVRDRLREGASHEESIDEDDWGQGRLDAWAAVNGATPRPDETPLNSRLELSFELLPSGLCRARATVEAEAGLETRLDLDYDGSWDKNWSATPHRWDVTPGATLDLRYDLTRSGALVGGGVWVGQVPERCPGPFTNEDLQVACGCQAASIPGLATWPAWISLMVSAARRRGGRTA
jgi:subtilisin family serine protease